jgi:hypothetical protein
MNPLRLSTALRSLAALGSDCASDEYINPPCGQTQPNTCIPLTMLFTPLCSAIFVAQLLGAVLAVPSPLLDSVCSRSLTHSHSVAYPQSGHRISFPGIQSTSYKVPPLQRYQLERRLLLPCLRSAHCIGEQQRMCQFQGRGGIKHCKCPGYRHLAIFCLTIRVSPCGVVKPSNHLHMSSSSDISCSGPGVTVMDSDKDLAEWKNRAKSARVFYLPTDVNTAYPNNAV